MPITAILQATLANLELQYQAFDPKLFRGRSAIPKRGIRDIYRQEDLQLTILSTTRDKSAWEYVNLSH